MYVCADQLSAIENSNQAYLVHDTQKFLCNHLVCCLGLRNKLLKNTNFVEFNVIIRAVLYTIIVAFLKLINFKHNQNIFYDIFELKFIIIHTWIYMRVA